MRKKLITRTIQFTNLTLLMANVETAEMYNEYKTIPGTYKDEKAMLKAARPLVEDDTHKLVSLVGWTLGTQLYGMPESDFMAQAKPIEKTTAVDAEVEGV